MIYLASLFLVGANQTQDLIRIMVEGGRGGGWGGWGLKELLREKNIETKVFPIAKFSMVAQVAQWYPVFYSIISCFQFLNSIKSNPVSFHLLPSSFESLDPTPELKTNTEPLGTIFR